MEAAHRRELYNATGAACQEHAQWLFDQCSDLRVLRECGLISTGHPYNALYGHRSVSEQKKEHGRHPSNAMKFAVRNSLPSRDWPSTQQAWYGDAWGRHPREVLHHGVRGPNPNPEELDPHGAPGNFEAPRGHVIVTPSVWLALEQYGHAFTLEDGSQLRVMFQVRCKGILRKQPHASSVFVDYCHQGSTIEWWVNERSVWVTGLVVKHYTSAKNLERLTKIDHTRWAKWFEAMRLWEPANAQDAEQTPKEEEMPLSLEDQATIELPEAIEILDGFISGYITEAFQRFLWTEHERIWHAAGSDAPLFDWQALQVKACEVVQFPVIKRFGLEASQMGLRVFMKAFTPEMEGNSIVAEKKALIDYLLDPGKQQWLAPKGMVPRGVPQSRLPEPHPDYWPEDSGKVWIVVGGSKSGGVVVRREWTLESTAYHAKLETNSLVEQLERSDDRLKYQLMDGSGPDVGWVSVSHGGRPLLEPLYFDPRRAMPRDPKIIAASVQVSPEATQRSRTTEARSGSPSLVRSSKVGATALDLTLPAEINGAVDLEVHAERLISQCEELRSLAEAGWISAKHVSGQRLAHLPDPGQAEDIRSSSGTVFFTIKAPVQGRALQDTVEAWHCNVLDRSLKNILQEGFRDYGPGGPESAEIPGKRHLSSGHAIVTPSIWLALERYGLSIALSDGSQLRMAIQVRCSSPSWKTSNSAGFLDHSCDDPDLEWWVDDRTVWATGLVAKRYSERSLELLGQIDEQRPLQKAERAHDLTFHLLVRGQEEGDEEGPGGREMSPKSSRERARSSSVEPRGGSRTLLSHVWAEEPLKRADRARNASSRPPRGRGSGIPGPAAPLSNATGIQCQSHALWLLQQCAELRALAEAGIISADREHNALYAERTMQEQMAERGRFPSGAMKFALNVDDRHLHRRNACSAWHCNITKAPIGVVLNQLAEEASSAGVSEKKGAGQTIVSPSVWLALELYGYGVQLSDGSQLRLMLQVRCREPTQKRPNEANFIDVCHAGTTMEWTVQPPVRPIGLIVKHYTSTEDLHKLKEIDAARASPLAAAAPSPPPLPAASLQSDHSEPPSHGRGKRELSRNLEAQKQQLPRDRSLRRSGLGWRREEDHAAAAVHKAMLPRLALPDATGAACDAHARWLLSQCPALHALANSGFITPRHIHNALYAHRTVEVQMEEGGLRPSNAMKFAVISDMWGLDWESTCQAWYLNASGSNLLKLLRTGLPTLNSGKGLAGGGPVVPGSVPLTPSVWLALEHYGTGYLLRDGSQLRCCLQVRYQKGHAVESRSTADFTDHCHDSNRMLCWVSRRAVWVVGVVVKRYTSGDSLERLRRIDAARLREASQAAADVPAPDETVPQQQPRREQEQSARSRDVGNPGSSPSRMSGSRSPSVRLRAPRRRLELGDVVGAACEPHASWLISRCRVLRELAEQNLISEVHEYNALYAHRSVLEQKREEGRHPSNAMKFAVNSRHEGLDWQGAPQAWHGNVSGKHLAAILRNGLRGYRLGDVTPSGEVDKDDFLPPGFTVVTPSVWLALEQYGYAYRLKDGSQLRMMVQVRCQPPVKAGPNTADYVDHCCNDVGIEWTVDARQVAVTGLVVKHYTSASSLERLKLIDQNRWRRKHKTMYRSLRWLRALEGDEDGGDEEEDEEEESAELEVHRADGFAYEPAPALQVQISLSPKEVIYIYDAFIKGYLKEGFQRSLWSEHERVYQSPISTRGLPLDRDSEWQVARERVCEAVQLPVIESFGFEASRRGLAACLRALGSERGNPSVVEKSRLIDYLVDPGAQMRCAPQGVAPRGAPRTRVENPHPDAWPEGSGKVWIVVGGVKAGGLVVRREESLDSPAYDNDRLFVGSLVEEEERVDERLKYLLMDGSGPDVGWVSISMDGQLLLQPLYFDLEEDDIIGKEEWRVKDANVVQRAAPTRNAAVVGVQQKGTVVLAAMVEHEGTKWLKLKGPGPRGVCYMSVDGDPGDVDE